MGQKKSAFIFIFLDKSQNQKPLNFAHLHLNCKCPYICILYIISKISIQNKFRNIQDYMTHSVFDLAFTSTSSSATFESFRIVFLLAHPFGPFFDQFCTITPQISHWARICANFLNQAFLFDRRLINLWIYHRSN